MKLSDPRYLDGATENYNGSKKKKTDVGARIDLAIKGALEELSGLSDMADRRDAFMRLLVVVRERTEMLRASEGKGSVGWASARFYVRRLQNVAARQAFWLRPLEGWTPRGAGARMQFRSLLEHLFVRYPVPAFMESAWDCEAGAEGFRQQSWYMRLARGAGMRSLNLPNGLTRRMEYLTRQAPDHFTVLQAFRYGEVRGLGGGEMLARALAESALGKVVENWEFWRGVIAFMVNHPELSSAEMNCMVEFIRATKFGGEEVLTETGKIKRGAPWPEFAMHGRTRRSILRVMREWGWEPAGKSGTWERSGLKPFRYLEKRPGGVELEWRMVELLNSSALRAESGAMRHCVYSYTGRCVRRISSIWSLRVRTENGEKRVLTVEVNPRTRRIVQVRAAQNRRPGGRSYGILRKWAQFARVGLWVR